MEELRTESVAPDQEQPVAIEAAVDAETVEVTETATDAAAVEVTETATDAVAVEVTATAIDAAAVEVTATAIDAAAVEVTETATDAAAVEVTATATDEAAAGGQQAASASQKKSSWLDSPQAKKILYNRKIIKNLSPRGDFSFIGWDSFREYERTLTRALHQKDINTIAITGNYGTGKSSFLKSYEESGFFRKYLHISLGSFGEQKSEEKSAEKIEIELLRQIVSKCRRGEISATTLDTVPEDHSTDQKLIAFGLAIMAVCGLIVGFRTEFENMLVGLEPVYNWLQTMINGNRWLGAFRGLQLKFGKWLLWSVLVFLLLKGVNWLVLSLANVVQKQDWRRRFCPSAGFKLLELVPFRWLLTEFFRKAYHTLLALLRIAVLVLFSLFSASSLLYLFKTGGSMKDVHALIVNWSMLLLLIGAGVAVGLLALVGMNRFFGVNLSLQLPAGGVEMEKKEKTEAMLDKYELEILYVLERIARRYCWGIVVEDLDRIELNTAVEVCARLRDINLTLQERGCHLRMIFTVNDEMLSKIGNYQKFFDYVMPLYPKVGIASVRDWWTGSEGMLEKMRIEAEKDGTFDKFLKLAKDRNVVELVDYRTCQDIKNQYRLLARLDEKKNNGSNGQVSDEKRLIFIIYKVLFPEDYYLLRNETAAICKNNPQYGRMIQNYCVADETATNGELRGENARYALLADMIADETIRKAVVDYYKTLS